MTRTTADDSARPTLRQAHTPRHTHEYVRAVREAEERRSGVSASVSRQPDDAASRGADDAAVAARVATASAPDSGAAVSGAAVSGATVSGAPAPTTPEPGARESEAQGSTLRRLMKASALMASGSIVSRMLGLVRTWLFGAVLAGNATVAANAFSAANTVPETVWILVGGGTLNAILVPAIVRATEQPDRGSDYISRLMTLVATVALGLTAISMLLVPVLIPLTSGILPPETMAMAVQLGLWMMPQIFFSAMYVMCGQLLNAHESFGPYQWAPVMNNLVGIIGAVIFLLLWGPISTADGWTLQMVIALAATNIGGSVAQVLFLAWFVRKLGLKLRPRWGFRGLGFGRLGRIGMWTLAMLTLGQASVWASRWAVGGAAAEAERLTARGEDPALYPGLLTLDWAYLAFMIPQGIIAVTLVTAIFPTMSKRASTRNHSGALETYAEMNRVLAIPMMLCTVVFAVLAAPIMWVIGGGTEPIGAKANGWVLVAYMVGLIPFSATYLIKRLFYAYEDARTPFMMQIPVAAVPIALALPILWWVDPQWATAAAALASSIGYLAGWIMGLFMVNKHAHRHNVAAFRAENRATLRSLIKLTAAASAAALVGVGLLWVVGDLVWTHRLVAVGLGGVIGLVMTGVFGGTAWALKVEELRSLASVLRRRRAS